MSANSPSGSPFRHRHSWTPAGTGSQIDSSAYDRLGDGRHRRHSLVPEADCTVHIGMAECGLDPGDGLGPHIHSYEETFFVLEGELELGVDGGTHTITAGAYGFLPVGTPHSWANAGEQTARWSEVAAPRWRSAGGPPDTFAAAGAPPHPEPGQGPTLGSFDGVISGGLSEAGLGQDIDGIGIEMLITASSGAAQSTLFIVEYAPGIELETHDHPYEEAYLVLDGTVEASAAGERYQLERGDGFWTGVGCSHGFVNNSDRPVRWLEVQAPQPPARNATRFDSAWAESAR